MEDVKVIVDGLKAIDNCHTVIEDLYLQGDRVRAFFDNGYGVSIIRNLVSYGNHSGKFELAVLIGDENDSHLCYDTDITDDVIGYLTANDAIHIAKKVSELIKEESYNE